MVQFATLRLWIAAVALGGAACGGSSTDTAAPPATPPAEPPPKVFRNSQAATGVLGQPDFASRSVNRGLAAPTDGTLSAATGVAAGEGLIVVADTGNQRVLAFRTPLDGSPGPEADFLVGRAGDFQEPGSVSVGRGKIAIADRMANRVLIYDAASPQQRPVVVGQPDMNPGGQVCDESHLWLPQAVQITPDGKLVVADSGHSRVLIWDALPTADGQPAQVVLGQAGFSTCVDNRGDGVPGRDSMAGPRGVWSDGVRLAVADTSNRRVVVWDALTMQSDQAPDRVLGQPDFGSSALLPPARDTLRGPTGLAADGSRFAVSDTFNNRVLVWNAWPSRDAQPADAVLGQSAFDLQAPNNGPVASAQTLTVPGGLALHEGSLLVTDPGSSRVLIFQPE